MNAILEARDMLRELTPLLTDCGELCNHACCKMDRDAGGLVWLWPGEEDTDMPWAETLFTHLPVTGLDVEAVRCAAPCARPSNTRTIASISSPSVRTSCVSLLSA